MSELSPSQLDALITLLEDPDVEVKNHVRDKILSLGAEVIPVLEEKWGNSFDPILQKEIEELFFSEDKEKEKAVINIVERYNQWWENYNE